MIESLKFAVLVLLFSDGTSRLSPMPARECAALASSVKRGEITGAIAVDGKSWRRISVATCAPQSALTARDRAIFAGN